MFSTIHARTRANSDFLEVIYAIDRLKEALIARGGSSMKEVKNDSTAHKNNLIEHMFPPFSNTIYYIPILSNRLAI